jgi:hypothetical protein
MLQNRVAVIFVIIILLKNRAAPDYQYPISSTFYIGLSQNSKYCPVINETIDYFGLVIKFIRIFKYKTGNYALQFAITHTHTY